MPEVAPVLIVGVVAVQVEAELVGGRLGCPSCRGVLGAWGHARERVLRGAGAARARRGRGAVVAAAAGAVPALRAYACAASGLLLFASS
jgi:hypothetical protein